MNKRGIETITLIIALIIGILTLLLVLAGTPTISKLYDKIRGFSEQQVGLDPETLSNEFYELVEEANEIKSNKAKSNKQVEALNIFLSILKLAQEKSETYEYIKEMGLDYNKICSDDELLKINTKLSARCKRAGNLLRTIGYNNEGNDNLIDDNKLTKQT